MTYEQGSIMKNELTTIRLTGTITAGRKKNAKIQILAYSGGIVHVDPFGAVLLSLTGMTLPRSLPLLDSHQNTTESLVGTGEPVVRGNKLFISGVLAQTEAGKRIVELVRGGHDLEASIGADLLESYFLREGETVEMNGGTHTAPVGDLRVVTKSVLRECSVLPIAADSSTKVQIAARAARGETMCQYCKREDCKGGCQTDDTAVVEAGRIEAICQLTASHPDIRGTALKEKWSADRTEMQVLRTERDAAELKALRATRPAPVPISSGVGSFSSSESEPEKILCGALLIHAGREKLAVANLGAELVGRAKHLRAHSLIDIVRAALSLRGISEPATKSETIKLGVSLIDMGTALGNSANLVALDAYREQSVSWSGFVKKMPVSDLKDNTMVRLSVGNEYELIAPGGELKHSTLGEGTSTVRAASRGTMLQIDRQSIINDDLGLLQDAAVALGRGGARAISDEIWRVILLNLDSAGNPFFHADNGNLLTGGGSALQFSSLTTALTSMVKQVDVENRVLDFRPRILVCSPENEVAARQLITSTTIARKVDADDLLPEGNPHNNLTLAVEARISNSNFTGFSATKWFEFTTPADGGIVLALLNGQEAPFVETVAPDPSVLGIVLRAYMDFGVSLSDPKPCLMSDGA